MLTAVLCFLFLPTGRNDSGEENVPLDLSRGGFSPVSNMLTCFPSEFSPCLLKPSRFIRTLYVVC